MRKSQYQKIGDMLAPVAKLSSYVGPKSSFFGAAG
jgi:hypothetical protein